jgi:hypothetical protein
MISVAAELMSAFRGLAKGAAEEQSGARQDERRPRERYAILFWLVELKGFV